MKMISFFLLLLVGSCGLIKNRNNNFQLDGEIIIHQPYCGGARPTAEMAKGNDSPYANQKFYVKTAKNNDKKNATVSTFSTNEQGKFTVELEAGSYFIFHENKIGKLDEFIAVHSKLKNEHYSYLGDDVALKVFTTPDFEWFQEEQTKMSLIKKSSCYTGLNPLIEYTGPRAP